LGLFKLSSAEARETATLALQKPVEKEHDAVDVAGSIASGLSLLILVFFVITFILDRRRFNATTINFIRFFSLCVIPILILPFATFSTFEDSKKVEFCQTCHTAMDLYVDDLKDKNSLTLAAVHYKNRYIQENHCFSCHAGYAVLDVGKAKATGLIHLYYWLTNSPTAMGKEQIKLYGEKGYENEYCLNCHSGSTGFIEAKGGIHRTLEASLLKKDPDTGAPQMSCLLCHGPGHLKLEEKNSPMIFNGKGLVTGQPGMNYYPSIIPGDSNNLERPYEMAPPPVPHDVSAYKITRTENTCLEACHLEGLEQVPSSHRINEHTGKVEKETVTGTRYNCLQCHLPQADEEPIVKQKKHSLASFSQKQFYQLDPSLDNKQSHYIGIRLCKLCHNDKKDERVYDAWKKTNHSRAYTDLKSQRGMEIAESMGVNGDPGDSKKCLKCHVTGYDSEKTKEASFSFSEGVQCEECHGAGSNYMSILTMKKLANGQIPAKSVGLIKPTKKLCLRCHTPVDKHILPFDEKTRFKKIAHWGGSG
jgi:nitrate reductase cytochrome c-type subunit